MARPQVKPAAEGRETASFVTSGSHMLDLVLGGNGWALARMANLVGDKSTGKTLLAIEACANLARITKPEFIRYGEAEAAFDMEYAETVGCPKNIRLSEPGALRTVEDWYSDLTAFLKTLPGGKVPALYVLDSFDSLSSDAEMERDFGQGSYGDGKAKLGSKMFRMLIQDLREKNCMLLIVSQIRDKLNVTFGETKTRSGGHALDFYASQIVWLAQVATESHTHMNIKRTTGIIIKAKNKKCKVGVPFRDAELTLQFGYGMDDETSMLEWLKETKRKIPFDGANYDAKELLSLVQELRSKRDREGLLYLNQGLRQVVTQFWEEIDNHLLPPMRKYE